MLQWIQRHSKTVNAITAAAGVMLVAVFYLSVFLPRGIVRAQETFAPAGNLQEGVEVIREPLGLPSTDIRVIVARIIRVALSLIGILLVALIIYAGFLWMTAGGNDEQINKAKSILKNAVIGLVIVLSAYSIAQFIFKLLGYELDHGGQSRVIPNTENFQGSGALGRIIKDHYPMRDQINVPRNTRIFVTFRRPVRLDSFVNDTTGDGILGNCRENNTNFNWSRDCDQLKFDDRHISIRRTDTQDLIAGGALLAASIVNESGIMGVFTIVIRPITDPADDATGGGYLGSPTEELSYKVRLGSEILLEDVDASGDPIPAFNPRAIGNNYYEWTFTNSTGLDLDPPHVESVFPDRNRTEAKNSVIQIAFDEAIDPIGIQGEFLSSSDEGGYFYVQGNNIFLKTFNSTRPVGTFELTSGYRVLEFTSSAVCGVNACGDPIFCLPVCDAPSATCSGDPKTDAYNIILKAARTISADTFEAMPFSGFMDASGNALDGDNDGLVDRAPTAPPIFTGNLWKVPDNDYWQFNINDEIDSVSPYLIRVKPGLDEPFVGANREMELVFSKRMRVEPMYDILIDEKPSQPVPLWRVPRVRFASPSAERTLTTVQILHGPFLDGRRQYYYPVAASTIQDVHFNCFYPGKGPGVDNVPAGTELPEPRRLPSDTECTGGNGAGSNCCLVLPYTPGKEVCCGGIVRNNAGTIENCRTYIQGISPL